MEVGSGWYKCVMCKSCDYHVTTFIVILIIVHHCRVYLRREEGEEQIEEVDPQSVGNNVPALQGYHDNQAVHLSSPHPHPTPTHMPPPHLDGERSHAVQDQVQDCDHPAWHHVGRDQVQDLLVSAPDQCSQTHCLGRHCRGVEGNTADRLSLLGHIAL